MKAATVACVEVGDYLGRGTEYVANLASMVGRNLSLPYEFACLTDQPERHPGIACQFLDGTLEGWWSKIELFAPGRFAGRVLYLDLDSVIVAALDRYFEPDIGGAIDLRDWGWKTATRGSGVMVWDAGEHEDAYSRFRADVTKLYRGDQDWLTHVGGWRGLPADWQRSYRYHAVSGPPPRCKVVCLHGRPKPHELGDTWVRNYWR